MVFPGRVYQTDGQNVEVLLRCQILLSLHCCWFYFSSQHLQQPHVDMDFGIAPSFDCCYQCHRHRWLNSPRSGSRYSHGTTSSRMRTMMTMQTTPPPPLRMTKTSSFFVLVDCAHRRHFFFVDVCVAAMSTAKKNIRQHYRDRYFYH